MRYETSRISAHHNYLVNNRLTPGFLLGDPRSDHGFYFLADPVSPTDDGPRISARLFDHEGLPCVELKQNRIEENPGACTYRSSPDGFLILQASGDIVLQVSIRAFANGFVTGMTARLFDEHGNIRMEPIRNSVCIHGEAHLTLTSPFDPSLLNVTEMKLSRKE
jgi:hypothetical protein